MNYLFLCLYFSGILFQKCFVAVKKIYDYLFNNYIIILKNLMNYLLLKKDVMDLDMVFLYK